MTLIKFMHENEKECTQVYDKIIDIPSVYNSQFTTHESYFQVKLGTVVLKWLKHVSKIGSSSTSSNDQSLSFTKRFSPDDPRVVVIWTIFAETIKFNKRYSWRRLINNIFKRIESIAENCVGTFTGCESYTSVVSWWFFPDKYILLKPSGCAISSEKSVQSSTSVSLTKLPLLTHGPRIWIAHWMG